MSRGPGAVFGSAAAAKAVHGAIGDSATAPSTAAARMRWRCRRTTGFNWFRRFLARGEWQPAETSAEPNPFSQETAEVAERRKEMEFALCVLRKLRHFFAAHLTAFARRVLNAS